MEGKGSGSEKLKSFDLTANVESLRYDIGLFGRIKPETWNQVRDEQLSYIAEGIDKASKTTYVLSRTENDGLVYFHKGKYRPYSELLDSGMKAAQHDAGIDERRQFLVGWAESDKYHHEIFSRLQPGEKHTWVSAYAEAEEQLFGKEFMRSCGLFPDRKLGFIYQATATSEGVILETQTIDNCDDQALATVADSFTQKPWLELDELVDVNDSFMSNKYGGKYHAGRLEGQRDENAWKEINANKDLVDYLLRGLGELAIANVAPGELTRLTKRHVYGVWALFAKRLSGEAKTYDDWASTNSGDRTAYNRWLSLQVKAAFNDFARTGQVLTGCGGSITVGSGEEFILDADSQDVHASIFSKHNGKTEVMKCVQCPLCKKQGVDATITYKNKEKVITCSSCKKSKAYNK